MKPRLMALLLGGLVGLALASPLSALAEDDNDHDLARDLYEQGEIESLYDILRIVREHAPGDIVAVDLVRMADKWVYRFQIVAADGRRSTLDVDARAATLMGDGAGD